MPSPTLNQSRLVALAILAWAIGAVLVGALGGTTFDDGDSLLHYLFGRYAFQHPANLLDLWAKPFFTTVTAPFSALGGFWGIRLFNIGCGALSAWLIYLSAQRMKLEPAWLAPFLLLCSTDYFLAANSGLTEPLFSLFLSAGLYLAVTGRYNWAAAFISFLPYVRSEGFLIVAVYFGWLVWIGRFRSLPWTALGFVIYGFVGLLAYGDFLWTFTQNPYDNGAWNYGKGTWGHFFTQYIYTVGLPVYVLTALGFVKLKLSVLVAKWKHPGPHNSERVWLVYGAFVAYFGAHVVFWATGKYHSLGLPRVMVAILPLGALIALEGLRAGLAWSPATASPVRKWAAIAVAIVLAAFPFSGNKAGFRLPKDFKPSQRLAQAQQVALFVHDLQPPKPLYYAAPALHLALSNDPFDSTAFRNIDELGKRTLPKGAILIWDTWFAQMESGVKLEFWEEPLVAPQFQLLKEWTDENGQPTYRVYRKISEMPPDA